MPIMGVSNGLLPIIGYCFGARIFKRLWQALKLASFGVMALMAVLTVLGEIFAPQIIGVFTREQALHDVGVPAMRIMLSSMILIGPSIMIVTTFQGLSKGKTALVLSLIRQFIVFVPLLFLFRYIWGLTGVWLCSPAADSLGILISLAFIYYEYRLHQRNDFLPVESKL
jgi:MATE family, multidrug efflux pump